jgi:hypothetical protein
MERKNKARRIVNLVARGLMFDCKDDLSLNTYSTRAERRMRFLLAGDVEKRTKEIHYLMIDRSYPGIPGMMLSYTMTLRCADQP